MLLCRIFEHFDVKSIFIAEDIPQGMNIAQRIFKLGKERIIILIGPDKQRIVLTMTDHGGIILRVDRYSAIRGHLLCFGGYKDKIALQSCSKLWELTACGQI